MKKLPKGKEFEIRKFLNEALSKKDDHYSFYEIQNFARLKKKEKALPKYEAISEHLKGCELCGSTYHDIVRFDPYLSKGNDIPNGYWESIWKEFEKNMPEELSILLNNSV